VTKCPFLDRSEFSKVSAYVILKDEKVVGRLLARYTPSTCEVGIQVFVDPNFGVLSGCNYSKTGKSSECGDRLLLATKRCLKEWGHNVVGPEEAWSLSDVFRGLGYDLFEVL